jgi:hypothetical protein
MAIRVARLVRTSLWVDVIPTIMCDLSLLAHDASRYFDSITLYTMVLRLRL